MGNSSITGENFITYNQSQNNLMNHTSLPNLASSTPKIYKLSLTKIKWDCMHLKKYSKINALASSGMS